MPEQTNTDTVEQTTNEVSVNPFEDFDNAFEKAGYTTPPGNTEAVSETETKAEDNQEQVTATTTTDSDNTTAEEEPYIYPNLKWNGTEKPLSEVLKANPEIIQELEKRFDYTQKTQALSEERTKFLEEKTAFETTRNQLLMDNIATQIGVSPKKPPLHDPMNEATDEVKKLYEVYSDLNSYTQAKSEYDDYTNRVYDYQNRLKSAETKNLEIINNFKTKSGKDDNYIANLLKKGQAYMNYAVAKGTQPLPEDTLEILDRAFNHDKIVNDLKAEQKKKEEAEYKRGFDEALKLQKTNKSQTTRVQTAKVTQGETNHVWDDFDNAFERYEKKPA